MDLLDSTKELLCMIEDRVGLKDLGKFLSFNDMIRRVASKHRLAGHEIHKANLTETDNDLGALRCCTFSDALNLTVHALRLVDDVRAMTVRKWDALSELTDWLLAGVSSRSHLVATRCYLQEDRLGYGFYAPRGEMPFQMQAGDKRPVITLLSLRLHYPASLAKALKRRKELFILQTMQRVAKLPNSLLLTPLRKVETHETIFVSLYLFHTAYA